MEQISVEEFLTNTEFTIPVNLPTTGKGSRTIKVTYQYDDDISEKIRDGITVDEETDEFEEDGVTKKKAPVKKSMPLNDQLALTVVKVDGVDTPPDSDFWKRTFLKYRVAILDAILRDVYPNAKISVG